MIRSKFNTIMILILASMFLFGFADSIDISAPTGQDDPSEADDNMRRIQAGYQQRLDVDHVFALSGTTVDAADTGEHKKVTFNTNISNPTPVAGKGHLYMKMGELFYQDATNTAKQLTDSGKLNVVDADGAVVKTGSQTIAGIKTFSSSPIVPAPTADLQASTKKYVDDQIAASVAKSAAKALGQVAGTGTLKSGSLNMTSVSRVSQGKYTLTFDTNFSDTNYSILCTIEGTSSGNARFISTDIVSTGACTVFTFGSNGSAFDSDFSFVAFGNQ